MNTTLSTPPKKERIFYLDLIRAIAIYLIVVTHFNHYVMIDTEILSFESMGINLGSFRVSLFLVLSGAALMYNYQGKYSLKTYYWKRFKVVFPIFWLTYIFAFAYMFFTLDGYVKEGVPGINFLYTVFGLDALASNYDIPTFYIVGEWFLGFILFFYALFPLLRIGIIRFPKITAAIILTIYVIILLIPGDIFGGPKSVFIFTRLPELAFGMYFMYYIKNVKLWVTIPLVAVLIGNTHIANLDSDLASTVSGIAMFMIVAGTAKFIAVRPVREFAKLIAKYSYAIFLVHHTVIREFFIHFFSAEWTTFQLYMTFACVLAITFGLSFALYKCNEQVLRFFKKAWDKRHANRLVSHPSN